MVLRLLSVERWIDCTFTNLNKCDIMPPDENEEVSTMDRGQRRSPQQPYRGQAQRPQQRPPQHRPAQSGRPSRPGPYRRRRRRSKKPWIIGAIILFAILLIVIISVSVHNAREDARLTAQIKANADAVTPFSDQIDAAMGTRVEKNDGFPRVVYDANGVRITLTGYKRDAVIGDELNYLFENNSSVSVMFGVGDAYVDGWQITTLGGDTLPAGTKTNGTIYIAKANLEESNISRVTNLTLKECSLWNDETYDSIDNFDITLNLE